jgi:hypothetical protein
MFYIIGEINIALCRYEFLRVLVAISSYAMGYGQPTRVRRVSDLINLTESDNLNGRKLYDAVPP